MGTGFSVLATAQWYRDGMKHYTRKGFEHAAKNFNATALDENLTGQIYAVTGGNSGLGKFCCKELARRGATVLMLCRDLEKGNVATREIIEETGNSNIEVHSVDVGNSSSVRNFAKEFLQSGRSLKCLINNAGAMFEERHESAEGLEATFAIMAGGTYLLTLLLLPALKAAAPSRVVNVSSGGMYTTHVDVKDLAMKKHKYSGTVAYARAKRAMVMLTEEWSARLIGTGIQVNSMHPGWVDTPGVQESMPNFYKRHKKNLRTVDQGADTILWLAISKEVADLNGQFFLDRKPQRKVLPMSGTAYNEQDRTAVWRYCEDTYNLLFQPEIGFQSDAVIQQLTGYVQPLSSSKPAAAPSHQMRAEEQAPSTSYASAAGAAGGGAGGGGVEGK